MSAPRALPTHRRARALIESLHRLGLREAIICPGSRNTPMILAVNDCADLHVRVMLDERSAAFVALGMARVLGRAVALICTSGSAAGHFLPAVMEASESRIPLLILTADRPVELQAVAAPQTTVQQHLFGAHARWFFDLGAPNAQVDDPRWVPSISAQAWTLAHGPWPGPVHLNVPFRKPLWMANDHDQARAEPPPRAPLVQMGSPRVDDAAVDALAARLAGAHRGLLMCGPMDTSTGGLTARQRRCDAIAALARTLGWPVFAEPTSQLRFGEYGLTTLVTQGDTLCRSPRAATLRPDVVVHVGAPMTATGTQRWLASLREAHHVLVDDVARLRDPHHVASTWLVGDIVDLCDRVRAQIGAVQVSDAWVDTWRALNIQAAGVCAQAIHETSALWEGNLAHHLVQSLSAGDALHVGNSMPVRDLDTFGGRRAATLEVFFNRGLNGIDGTIATAAGEALARGTRVVVWVGDLTARHDLAGMALALELGVSLTVVVVDNDGGGIFEFLPIAAHEQVFEPFFLTPQHVPLSGAWTGLGARVSAVSTVEAFNTAMAQAAATPGVTCVVAQVARDTNVARHHAFWHAVSLAVTETP